MLEEFRKFIGEQKLLATGEKVLLAVSGGVDSMVMAELFLAAGADVGIAHVNYGLRGADSDGDEQLVSDFSSKNSLSFHVKRVDPSLFAASESIQMVARVIRYDFFRELTETHGYNKIATAHHLDDSYETILLNLVKGTGIQGMKGISCKSGNIIRPLLFTDRQGISDFALNRGLSWREDASNHKDIYQRNLIRNKVMPVLRELNPNLTHTYEDTRTRLEGAAMLIDQKRAEILTTYSTQIDNGLRVGVDWVLSGPGSLALLWEVFSSYGFNFSQVKSIHSSILDKKVGAVFDSDRFQLNVDRNQVVIRERNEHIEGAAVFIFEDSTEVSFQGKIITLETIFRSVGDYPGSENVALLDKSKLQFPLELRKWKNGDRFTPLGMKGRKMVSDFMIDRKIPVSLKEDVLVLVSNGEIAWVVNHRISELFKLTDMTKNVLKITFKAS